MRFAACATTDINTNTLLLMLLKVKAECAILHIRQHNFAWVYFLPFADCTGGIAFRNPFVTLNMFHCRF